VIRLSKKGRRIVITADEPLPGIRTAVPGAYESTSGYWTVPLSLESCKLLRQKYGKRLEMDSELRRWATGVVESRRYMARLAAAPDARLEVVPYAAPRLYKAMRRRKYQRTGARFVADNHATLIADDPGLGKTLIAMAGILEAQVPGPYLVVAPKTAADTVWRREIQRWLPRKYRVITLPDQRYMREYRIRTTYDENTWLIIHPEIVMVQAWHVCKECGEKQPETKKTIRVLKCGHPKRNSKLHLAPNYPRLFEQEWGAVIVDESHESLIRRTGVTTQRRRGLDLLRLRPDGMRLAMSGTPFDSKPHQLYGTLNWLDPKTYSAFHRWAELYWRKGGYTGYEIGEFIKEREPLLWDSLSAIALRRTKAEVAPDLPPKMEVGTLLEPHDPNSPLGVWLEMEGEQRRAYEQMEKLSVADLESGRLEAVTALAELTRLKQLASAYGDIIPREVRGSCFKRTDESPVCKDCKRHGWHTETQYKYVPRLPSNKFDWIAGSLEEWGYPRNPITKVVVVSFYTGILEVMAAGLEKHFKTKPAAPLCTAITGRTTGNRKDIIDQFNRPDGPQVMMLNVKAGGVAITIDSADRMIFVSETRIPDQQKQAEDRIHRVSNPRQCMYYYLRSLGTVDVGTALINQEMIADSHRLLDARRGVEYMRHAIDLSHPLARGTKSR
jgi:SNF2 family DNA or RNA helicase